MTNFSLIMTDIFLDQNDNDQSIRFKKIEKSKKNRLPLSGGYVKVNIRDIFYIFLAPESTRFE